jgi:omega-6 fatty acid desaturase (delta-12 desaturase)
VTTAAQPRSDAPSVTDWRRVVEPYIGPDDRYATFQLVTTLALLGLGFWVSHWAVQNFLPLALLLSIPLGGLLVRTFIFMHDCAHGSFYTSRTANELVGYFTGVVTLTPFGQWRRDHALHHASSGDLDRRGHGDVPTLTVREYLERSPKQQRAYRFMRHPAVLLFGGPPYLALNQRTRSRSKATGSQQITSVWLTNLGLVALVTAIVVYLGWKTLLVAYLLPYYFAAMAGVWLFYVQHQFEDAYWTKHKEWDYVDASLRGSSYLVLPAVLRWFSGNIGVHHVHHVAPRIPNFRLKRCHDENPLFHDSPKISWRTGMAALRLALWDEDTGRLIAFKDLKTANRSN